LYSPTHLGQMKLTLPSRPLFSLLRLDNQTYATIANASVTHLNTYRGGVYQQTTSGVAITNQDCYELDSDVIAPFFLRRFLCSSSTSASSSLTSGLTGLLLRLRKFDPSILRLPRRTAFLISPSLVRFSSALLQRLGRLYRLVRWIVCIPFLFAS
jgi:hypothetical protein